MNEQNVQHDQTKMFQVEEHGAKCHSCGLRMHGTAFKVPKLSGAHCSIDCVKVHPFGTDRRQWCSKDIPDAYVIYQLA
jgi:hypothetical protein